MYVDVVVTMLKGTQCKLTMDFASLDMLDWHLHIEHGQGCKLDLGHINDLTIAMCNGPDLGLVDCLLKDRGNMFVTLCYVSVV